MNALKGPLCLFGAFTLAGTSVISARFVTEKLGTFTITAMSLCFGLMLLLPLCHRKLIPALRRMRPEDWLRTAFQAFFGIFLFRMLLLNGLVHTTAGEAGILTGATPAVTAILAWMILKEPVNIKNAAGIISTVGGILLIQGLLTPGRTLSLPHFLGNIMVLGAAVSESVFNVSSRISAVKNTSRKQQNDPLMQTALVSAIALLLCLIPALFEQPFARLSVIGFEQWLALVWYGVFVTAMAFICWYAGISRCRVSVAAAFSGMMPLTALILSVTVLKETAGWPEWLGALLVIIGMVVIGTGKKTGTAERKVLADT